jgi:hypothetical protein
MCQQLAEPLAPWGFKYRKSQDDILKRGPQFTFSISMQPLAKLHSDRFLAAVTITSVQLSLWRQHSLTARRGGDLVLHSWLWAFTPLDPQIGLQGYEIGDPTSRDRTITQITAQLNDHVLPFFAAFDDLQKLVADVREVGFLPHRRKRHGTDYSIDHDLELDFCDCFGE